MSWKIKVSSERCPESYQDAAGALRCADMEQLRLKFGWYAVSPCECLEADCPRRIR